MMIDIASAVTITKALGGQWRGSYGLCRCPAHNDHSPSLTIRDGEHELIVNCFAGCDWRDVKAELQRQGLIEGFTPTRTRNVVAPRHSEPDTDQAKRVAIAMQIWAASIPLPGTLGWRYFTERRALHIGLLDRLDHTLRWHAGINAIVGLMTDPQTSEACGIHRTFLDPGGMKRERKMLGRQGVIRLSDAEAVTMGLGIVEGIEDGLAVLLSGWRPVWAATSAGAIKRFPVLHGIESLTIFADNDATGMKAARVCAACWKEAGREARLSDPKALTDAA